MGTQDTANALAKTFSEIFEENYQLINKAEDLFNGWHEEIKPILDLMVQYGMVFRNPKFNGKSKYGIIVGKTVEDPGC